MKRHEGSPNEEGTCTQIIPTTGSIDTLIHYQVTCSTDAHSQWIISTNASGEKFSNCYILLVQAQWEDSTTEQVKQQDEEVNEEKDTEKSDG